MGVIVNKVLPSKFAKINNLVRKGLRRQGIDVLGVIPYNPLLASPTIGQILEETNYKLFCGKEYLDNPVSRTLVGAMKPKDAIKYIVDDSLLITPAGREDLIMAALQCFRNADKKKAKICGIVLTGESNTGSMIMQSLKQTNIPVLLAENDTYSVASRIYDLTVKIRPRDASKIAAAVKMVKNNVDLNFILKRM